MHFDDLPSGWLTTTLGNVVEYGKTQKCELSDVSNDTWILELEDIEKESSKIVQRLNAEARPFKSTKNKFKKGDVLYGKLRPYLNKVVIADQNGVCSTEIIPLDAEPSADNRYLFYWLKGEAFLNYVVEVSYGVNMPRLGTQDGLTAPFVLPPLAEQKVIAEKLDTLLAQVDNTKARLERIPELLKRFRQSVLAAAVSGKLAEDNGLKKRQLSSIKVLGKLIGGKTPSKSNERYWENGKIPWVSPKDMKSDFIDGSIDHITELALGEAGMRLLPENTLLMVTRSGILAHSFPVALTKVPVTINQDIKAFTADTGKVRVDFCLYLIKGLEQRILNECSKAGTTVPSVETKLLENLTFELPTLEEQTEIVRRVEELFAFADRIEQAAQAALSRVNNLTQSILAKAFRGELTLEWRAANPELISGENSAEALLARIKAERARGSTKKRLKTKKITV